MRPMASDDPMVVDEPNFPPVPHPGDLPVHSSIESAHLALPNDRLNDGSRWKSDGH
jgi:hypothetical protein